MVGTTIRSARRCSRRTPPADHLNGTGACQFTNESSLVEHDNRCGLGPRLPFLLISPYAKSNYVDNTLTEQSSILKFVEQNWSLGSIGAGSEDVDSGTRRQHVRIRQRPARAEGHPERNDR